MRKQLTDLINIAKISIPPVAVYQVSDTGPFQPFASPVHCIFQNYPDWQNSQSTVISRENASDFGCAGTGYWMCGIESMPRENVTQYLVGQEGLKDSTDTYTRWLENHPPFQLGEESIVISQLRDDQYDFLKTATFFVNADQLALFLTGAEYRNGSSNCSRVTAPYGSGCGMLLALLQDFDEPHAVIGATDIAMRKYLPPDILAFTVNKPMLEQLCGLNDKSFLHKSFWQELQKARKNQ